MIKKIKMTKRTGNDNYFDVLYQNNDINFPFKVVDKTSLNTPKRVLIYIKDTSPSFLEQPPIWKEFNFNSFTPTERTFDLMGTYSIGGFYNNSPLFEIQVVTGKKYQLNSTGDCFELMGNASGPSKIEFYNNKSSNIYLRLKKSGSLVAMKSPLSAGQTTDFTFSPTFWIHATTNFNSNPPISNVNTEIGYLGVGGCSIDVTYSNPVFSFSLSNIIYS